MFETSKILKTILGKKFYSKFLIITLLQVVAVLLEIFSISLIIPIIDIFFSGNQNKYTIYLQNNFFTNLNITNILVFTIVIFLLKFMYLIFVSFKRNKLMQDINNYLSEKITKYFLNLKYLNFSKNSKSKLIRDANDVRFVVDYVKSCNNLISEILILIGFLIFSLNFNLKLTVITFIYFSFFAYIYYISLNKKIKLLGKKRRDLEKQRFNILNNIFRSFVNVKLFAKEKYFLNKFMFKNKEFESNFFQLKIAQDIPKNYFELLSIILIATFLIYISSNNVSSAITSDLLLINLSVMVAVMYKITPSIMKIILNKQYMSFTKLTATNIVTLEKLNQNKPKYSEKIKSSITFQDCIKINNLSFKYSSKEKDILNNINLKIKIGEMIGIKGRSGQGKSTFINIISGLITPYKGSILVDNKKIHENLREWQKNICYIPQNANLNEDNIRENIAFGEKKELIKNIKIKKILKRVNLEKFSNKLYTEISDSNLNFSGGQIQRIGIARSLYHDRSLLILDEATNSLDSETEKKILLDLKKIKKNKIIIFISHREMKKDYFDKIYEIKKGKIIKQN